MRRYILTFLIFFQGLIAEENMIGYKVVGTGSEKVLVMHNWFSDSTCYDPILPYLDTDQFTFVFVDWRGYGQSKDISGVYSVDEASADAIKIADHLSWDSFHLIGHSMSGMIAQKIALDNTTKVKSVIAITPVPASGSHPPQETMAFLQSAAQDNDDNAMGCVQLLTSQRYDILFAKKIVSNWRKCSTPEARLGYLNMFAQTDFSESVIGLQTPMLVLYAEYDLPGTGALFKETFMKWYPNAKLDCLPCAGHFPMQETPVNMASVIEKFLTKNKS